MPPRSSSSQGLVDMEKALKPKYPRLRLDPYGMKFAKGHRSHWMLTGQPPVTRTAKRAK